MFLGLPWYTYDFEVFAHDWLVDFKEMDGEHITFANDSESLCDFMYENEDAIFCGFNTKHYDVFIMKACVADNPAEEVKGLNDFIIAGNSGWQHRIIQENRFRYNNVDIMDDMQEGQSLKSIEGHLYMNIEETEVDFNIQRFLTEEELLLTQKYCRHDVEATEEITKLRKAYLKTKIDIGAMAGIPPEKALAMTNAKLTAAYLGAQLPRKPWTDERDYKYPANLKREYIPEEVFKFFDRMHDPSIPYETLWKGNLEISVGGTPTTMGFGGIHAAIPNYIWKEGVQA